MFSATKTLLPVDNVEKCVIILLCDIELIICSRGQKYAMPIGTRVEQAPENF